MSVLLRESELLSGGILARVSSDLSFNYRAYHCFHLSGESTARKSEHINAAVMFLLLSIKQVVRYRPARMFTPGGGGTCRDMRRDPN